MTRNKWHITRDETGYTLARQIPARFDFAVYGQFPELSQSRLASQISQDLWRALQDIRGYSPVIQIERNAHGLMVRAGGRLINQASKKTAESRAAECLENPLNLARWCRCARLKRDFPYA